MLHVSRIISMVTRLIFEAQKYRFSIPFESLLFKSLLYKWELVQPIRLNTSLRFTLKLEDKVLKQYILIDMAVWNWTQMMNSSCKIKLN